MQRMYVVIFAGHDIKGDYPAWLRRRLGDAAITVSELDTTAAAATGHWGGMPCQVRHIDDITGGPIIITTDPADHATAMTLPSGGEYGLAPPLAAFADACGEIQPPFALYAARPLDDAEIEHQADALDDELAAGLPGAAPLHRPFTALYLHTFWASVLEADFPDTPHERIRLGGEIFLSADCAPMQTPWRPWQPTES